MTAVWLVTSAGAERQKLEDAPVTGRFTIDASGYGPSGVGETIRLPQSTGTRCACGSSHHAYRIEHAELWMVDGEMFNGDGFVICAEPTCMEALGSPWCCDQRVRVVESYQAQRDRIHRREQATAEQIVRWVNAQIAGAR